VDYESNSSGDETNVGLADETNANACCGTVNHTTFTAIAAMIVAILWITYFVFHSSGYCSSILYLGCIPGIPIIEEFANIFASIGKGTEKKDKAQMCPELICSHNK